MIIIEYIYICHTHSHLLTTFTTIKILIGQIQSFNVILRLESCPITQFLTGDGVARTCFVQAGIIGRCFYYIFIELSKISIKYIYNMKYSFLFFSFLTKNRFFSVHCFFFFFCEGSKQCHMWKFGCQNRHQWVTICIRCCAAMVIHTKCNSNDRCSDIHCLFKLSWEAKHVMKLSLIFFSLSKTIS